MSAPVNPYGSLAYYTYVKGKTRISPQSVNLQTSYEKAVCANLTLGEGLTGSAISASVGFAQYTKIFKVFVFYKSIDVFDGTETIQLVVESAGDYNSIAAPGSDARELSATPYGSSAGFTASYTAGEVPAEPAGDNSESPGPGYPTNFAAVGDCVFGADLQFNAANFPSGGTTGGGQVFAPTWWDTVYAAGTILSLRAVTTASTGSITDLGIVLFCQSVDKKVSNDRGIPLLAW